MKFKPYELVRVKEEGYSYIGEAVSFETPEGTVMVRRVPGHPGTLEEQPVAKLVKLDSQRGYYIHYATVDGRGSFPVDMLRYDNAAPLNFSLVTDARSGFTVPQTDPALSNSELIVAKCCKHIYTSMVWTPARWSSFLWGIKPRNVERYQPGK